MPPSTVTVRVPATSANLGPGFDALGLALELAAEIRLTTGGSERATSDPVDRMDRMILAAAREAFSRAGQIEPEGLRARVTRSIPLGRGLGASAVARAAGILGANVLMGAPLDEDTMLELGSDLEGHADNFVPALLGGLQVVVRGDSGLTHVGVPLPADLRVVLLVPDFNMPTRESRKRLPDKLSRGDAVFNISRAALLVAAVAAGRYDAMAVATEDRLHQPARSSLFPAMPEIIAAALGAGAHAAYLSGGGSTIAAWATEGTEQIAAAMTRRATAAGIRGEIIHTRPSAQGASVLSEG